MHILILWILKEYQKGLGKSRPSAEDMRRKMPWHTKLEVCGVDVVAFPTEVATGEADQRVASEEDVGLV